MNSSIKEQVLITDRGENIACASRIPERVDFQIVIIHGFSENMRYYYRAADLMAAQGGAVHLMDLPGHGLSSGPRGHIDDFQQYIDAVDFFINSNPDFIKEAPTFFFGHSMGGSIAFHYYTQKSHDFRGLILLAPLVGFTGLYYKWIDIFARALSLKDPKHPRPKEFRPWDLVRDSGKWGQYYNDPYYNSVCSPRAFLEMSRAAGLARKKAPVLKTPLLIFSTTADPVVSYQKTLKFWRKVGSKDKTLAVFSQALHHLIQEEESGDMIDKTLSWIKKRI